MKQKPSRNKTKPSHIYFMQNYDNKIKFDKNDNFVCAKNLYVSSVLEYKCVTWSSHQSIYMKNMRKIKMKC